jgi:hypothetical protein
MKDQSAAAAATVIGGAAIILGSVMPWARAGLFAQVGTESNGVCTMLVGAALVVIGLIALSGRRLRSDDAAFCGIAAIGRAGWTIWNLWQSDMAASIGEGLYLVIIGGVIALAGAAMDRVQ